MAELVKGAMFVKSAFPVKVFCPSRRVSGPMDDNDLVAKKCLDSRKEPSEPWAFAARSSKRRARRMPRPSRCRNLEKLLPLSDFSAFTRLVVRSCLATTSATAAPSSPLPS